MITIAALFDEIAWTAPADADLTGYSMDAYFAADVHAEHATREDAVAAARASYRGQDAQGVGLDLDDLDAAEESPSSPYDDDPSSCPDGDLCHRHAATARAINPHLARLVRCSAAHA